MKIVFFDYWTAGIHNFIPINNRLVSNGHKTMLLHIGSFRNPKIKKEETIEGILCRDIGYYKTKYLFKALKEVCPDVIISLNTYFILDRSLVLSCRKLRIKTVFMMCGDRPTGSEIRSSAESQDFSFNKKIKKAYKYLFIGLPNYLLATWKQDKLSLIRLTPLRVVFLTFINPGKYLYYPPNKSEILHDKCMVYAKKYVRYYQKLGYDKQSIIVAGNPKHDSFFKIKKLGFPKELVKSEIIKSLITRREKFALYLEDSFQEQGMAGWSYEYLSQHLFDISNRLREEGVKLVVKLHPATNMKKITQYNDDIIFVDSDLEHLIFYSNFCIAHMSTTVNLAILLNKKILIPQWDKSNLLPDYYVKHKVAKAWANLADDINFPDDEESRHNYIDENITITSPISINLLENEITQ